MPLVTLYKYTDVENTNAVKYLFGVTIAGMQGTLENPSWWTCQDVGSNTQHIYACTPKNLDANNDGKTAINFDLHDGQTACRYSMGGLPLKSASDLPTAEKAKVQCDWYKSSGGCSKLNDCPLELFATAIEKATAVKAATPDPIADPDPKPDPEETPDPASTCDPTIVAFNPALCCPAGQAYDATNGCYDPSTLIVDPPAATEDGGDEPGDGDPAGTPAKGGGGGCSLQSELQHSDGFYLLLSGIAALSLFGLIRLRRESGHDDK